MKYRFIIAFFLVWLSCTPYEKTPDPTISHTEVSFPRQEASEPLPELNLTFAGDIMSHTTNYSMPGSFSDIYSSITGILSSDDLSFANLESPVVNSKPYAGYPRFNIHTPYIEAAIDAGFDVFSLANNHTCDQDGTGITETVTAMDDLALRRGIEYSGISAKKGAGWNYTTFDVRDWKIGFIAVTAFSNRWDDLRQVNFLPYRSQAKPNMLVSSFLSLVDKLEAEVDILVVSIHDGIEHARTPLPETELFYHSLIDRGVDIVWAHHPHVLQPWEIYPGPDGDRIVIFSAGNLISAMAGYVKSSQPLHYAAATGDEALYRIQFVKSPDGLQIAKTEAVPISVYYRPGTGFIILRQEEIRNSSMPDSWKQFYAVRESSHLSFMPVQRISLPPWASLIPGYEGAAGN